MTDKANYLDRFMAPIIIGLVAIGAVTVITISNGEVIYFIDSPSLLSVIVGSMLVMSLVGHAAPRHEVLDRFWTLPIWIGLASSLIELEIGFANFHDVEMAARTFRDALLPLLYGIVFGGCILKPISIHEAWRNPPGDGKKGATGFISLHIMSGLLLALLIQAGMMALMFISAAFYHHLSR